MGLDAVDLTFRLEKRFAISISREEVIAFFWDDVDRLYRYLLQKNRQPSIRVPKMDRYYLEVSQAVKRVTSWYRYLGSSNLNRLFPPVSRRAQWQELAKELKIDLPDLDNSKDSGGGDLPVELTTVLSLAYWIADRFPEKLEWIAVENGDNVCLKSGMDLSDQGIWDGLVEELCGVLGVDREEIKPESKLVEDLGMD